MIKKMMLALVMSSLYAIAAFAQDGEAATTVATAAKSGQLQYIAAALTMGLAVIGGALGQGRAAASALEGIARNPSARTAVFAPMLIALALMEALVILGFVIAITLANK